MAEWTPGPRMHDVARMCRDAIYRHGLAFGPNHGLDQLLVISGDLSRLTELLLVFGVEVEEPAAVDPFDDFVFFIHGPALLWAHSAAKLTWSVYDDGQRRIAPDVLPAPMGFIGWPPEALEELFHKVLAACGLVPWRHLDKLPVDLDGDGEAWLDVAADGTWTPRDA